MKYIKHYFSVVFVNILGKERIKKLIRHIASMAKLDLLMVAYNDIGILKYENYYVSGEYYLVSKVLKKNFEGISRPIIFDVGANIGKYSQLLAREFSYAQIFAFEPNENTYNNLVKNVAPNVQCFNVGIGLEEKIEKIYTYSDNLSSSHASIYEGVFSDYHKRDDVVELEIKLTTLDLFCEQKNVSSIDFLKIDTEGNEINVLNGARDLLTAGKIKMIQFEFGECAVFSRIFLRDFYEILSDYCIYRLDSERLIPIFEYNTANEIFRFQNLFAVRRDFLFNIEK